MLQLTTLLILTSCGLLCVTSLDVVTPTVLSVTQNPGRIRNGVTQAPLNPYVYFPAPTGSQYEITLPADYTVPPEIANRSSVSGTYLLTIPERAIPGFNFTLGFESFLDKPVNLKAQIYNHVRRSGSWDYDDIEVVSTYGVFTRGTPGLLHLPVPDNLKVYSGEHRWKLSCVGINPNYSCPFVYSDGRRFYKYNSLSVVSDVTTILIQTDKAIYKPGQIVHYRVFAVYPDLQMYKGNFTIEVKDPNGNKIQYLQEVSGQAGVVEGSLGLADQPVFGRWTVSVTIKTSTRSESYSKSFSVEQYQLPRFEVVVDLPSYILTTDSELQGSVKATYTFGQPVKGMVELHVMSSTARPDYCGNEPRHMELSFDINGEAKFSIPRSDISRVASLYSGSSIKVTASVKEDLTDVTLEGSATVTYHSTPYKLRILDNTPNVFKPGLPFSVFALASMQDDSPPTGNNNTMSLFVTVHYTIRSSNRFLYKRDEFNGNYPLPVQTTVVPPSGVVKMDLGIPSNATSLDVTVVFKDLTASRTIQKMFSISDNYLQLVLLDKDLKSGQTAHIEARATEPMSQLYYQILSRRVVVDSKIIDAQGQHLMTFDVALTSKMAPTSHMMAYYVRPDLEIIPDSMAFNVEGIFDNEVSLEISTNMSEPHAALNLTLTADPDSLVNVLALDKSVLLLKSGNDIDPEEISIAVASYDRGDTPADSQFALSLSQRTAKDTLKEAGVYVTTDAQVSLTSKPYPSLPDDPSIYGPEIRPVNPYGELPTAYPPGYTGETPTAYPPGYTGETPTAYPPWYTGDTPTAYPPGYMGETPTAYPPGYNGPLPTAFPQGHEGGEEGLKEVERIRSFFPETWLWLNKSVGANGSTIVNTVVPDTITSWVITAFATNMKTGLGITPSSSTLTVFRSFFVSLTMPGSVVRGEHVVIQASVFNYLSSDVSVLVSLPGSADYTSIVIADDGSESFTNNDVEHTVLVKSQGQTAVYFPVIPSAVGAVDIEVSARSTLSADAVRRQLVVVAEGVPTEFSIPVFINLESNSNGTDVFTQNFPVSVPDDVIDGSMRSRIKVTGDVLGPSVDGLDNLLRMPTGCGEQNMIKLAPDLYIANYLTVSGQMTGPMHDRIKFLIETGYQRELTYQRQDGAFSAFGDRDNTGSTWLTSFVLRVFHEARPYVYVDDEVLQRAINWITKRQNEDGSFNEFGHIYDFEMRRFKDHSTGLTSFVLMALIENADVPDSQNEKMALRNAVGNATAFLENNYHNISADDYLSLALTCLALTKAGSPVADTLLNILISKSTTEHGMTFWKTPITTNRINPYSRWRPTYVRARPIDIHVTAYALLVYTERGMFQEGMNVLHWLTRQRNPYGGFSSTQDTVVGLYAMTEFVYQAVPGGFDLHLDVRAQHTDAHFDITPSNALVFQSKDLSFVPSEVTFNATGNGVAVAELDVFFNVETDLGEPAFEVSTVLLDDYLNSFKVMICTRWLLKGESGMVVQEVGIPSGFSPDMTSVGNVAGIKRSEQKGRFLDIYFEKITRNSLCYTVMFDRQSMVAQSQPSYIITQDYYEPTNRATATYQSLSLKESEVCDVCPDCCNKA